MSIFQYHNSLPQFRNAVITIGSFDGVHHGHKKILKTLVDEAKKVNGESIVITFHPHPRKVIRPDVPIQLISSNEEKYSQILRVGVDHIVEVPFTRSFSLLSAEEYVNDFLLKKFKPHTIIIGYDHQFGHDRKGNLQLLESMVGMNVKLIEIPVQFIDDANVSSTKIRNAVMAGEIDTAAAMLGRPYSFSGLVIHGKKLGRKLGFPTANLKPIFADQLLPPAGIYAVWVTYQDRIIRGAMSIGKNPTISEKDELNYEVYLLDFDEELYGQELKVDFVKKIREEQKFLNLDSLIDQMKLDVEQVRSILIK